MSSSEFLLSLLFLSYLLPSVYSTFTYKFGAPGSCDNLEITWTGQFVLLVRNLSSFHISA